MVVCRVMGIWGQWSVTITRHRRQPASLPRCTHSVVQFQQDRNQRQERWHGIQPLHYINIQLMIATQQDRQLELKRHLHGTAYSRAMLAISQRCNFVCESHLRTLLSPPPCLVSLSKKPLFAHRHVIQTNDQVSDGLRANGQLVHPLCSPFSIAVTGWIQSKISESIESMADKERVVLCQWDGVTRANRSYLQLICSHSVGEFVETIPPILPASIQLLSISV